MQQLTGINGYDKSVYLLTLTTVAWVKRLVASVCDSVCPHDKVKTAETKIAKLGTVIVHHDTVPTN